MTKQIKQKTSDVDMSPDAIDRRLRNVSQLYKLGMAIRKARGDRVDPSEELPKLIAEQSEVTELHDRNVRY